MEVYRYIHNSYIKIGWKPRFKCDIEGNQLFLSVEDKKNG